MKYIPAVWAALLLTGFAHTTQAPPRDAALVMAEARQALGGEKRLSSIKTFSAAGRTRRLQGESLVPIEFEILAELPDKYVRRDEIPAQESGPTSRGFNGDGLIQLPLPAAPAARGAGPAGRPGGPGGPVPPVGPGANAPPPDRAGALPPAPGRTGGPAAFVPPKSDPLSGAKQDFARLMLGMFAASFEAYPLTFARIGEAEAPQGKADVILVTGPGGSNFALRWLVSGQSHLPILVSWQMPASSVVVTVPGQAKPANLAPGAVVVEGPAVPAVTASKEEIDAFTKAVADLRRKGQATLVEHRLYFADYRDVGGGVQWPFRVRRAIGADTVEETIFDGFKLNPKIDPRRFEVAK